MVLYILVAISAVSVVGWEELSRSDAPLADIAFSAFGSNAFILLTIIALFATANTVLLMMLGSSRIIYGMADSMHLPNILSRIHVSRKTPWTAIIMTAMISLLFVFAGEIVFVANVANFTLFVTFFVINAALIVLRFKKPDAKRQFRVPVTIGKFPVLAMLGVLFNVFMLFQLEAKVLLIGTAIVVAGGLLSFIDWKR